MFDNQWLKADSHVFGRGRVMILLTEGTLYIQCFCALHNTAISRGRMLSFSVSKGTGTSYIGDDGTHRSASFNR